MVGGNRQQRAMWCTYGFNDFSHFQSPVDQPISWIFSIVPGVTNWASGTLGVTRACTITTKLSKLMKFIVHSRQSINQSYPWFERSFVSTKYVWWYTPNLFFNFRGWLLTVALLLLQLKGGKFMKSRTGRIIFDWCFFALAIK